MMNHKLLFAGIYLLAVFISSLSQILLKKTAQEPHENVLAEYLDPRVVVAYVLFLGATFVTVLALKHVPVSLGTVLESAGYLFVTALGVTFLHEQVSKRKLIGLGVILAGIMIYAL